MSMTRKDFKAIAEIIRKYNLIGTKDGVFFYELVNEFATYFKKANSTFDHSKFMKSCGWYNIP